MKTFKRVLVKISGEALSSQEGGALDFSVVDHLVDQLAEVSGFCQIAVVLGGGNFFRGESLQSLGLDRGVSDQVGMLGTLINGMILRERLLQKGVETILFSSLRVEGVASPFEESRKVDLFDRASVVIFSGGIGQPYFTTDTAAVLWALRVNCEIVFKGTQVDGIYNADPRLDSTASLLKSLTYQEALEKKLRVMDLTALTLAEENTLPLVVFNIKRPGAILKALRGEPPLTWVFSEKEGVL
ncbi:MAG: UMP kinase [Holosporales bacterium]